MEESIINKVALSSLITLDLEDLYNTKERVHIDIADFLFEGIILKEKVFREMISQHNWTMYLDKYVAITCTADVIVPHWAYMIMVSKLVSYAIYIQIGTLEELNAYLYSEAIASLDIDKYINQKVVIKGCGTGKVPIFAYGEIVRRLTPVVSSIMFGEPCSTVPVFKKK